MILPTAELQNSPFVTVDRFSELTGLTKSQVTRLIREEYLPVFKLSNSKQISKAYYINLLQIKSELEQNSSDVINLNQKETQQ